MAKKAKGSPITPDKSLVAGLPLPGDPLILPDGRKILPDELPGSARVETDAVLGSSMDHRTFRPVKKRTIHELPAPKLMLNAISCVLMYTILGLSDREICELLEIKAGELNKVRNHAGYAECFDTITEEFINANSKLIHARLAAYSNEALTTVANIATGKEPKVKPDTKLRAADSILDRAGIGNRSDRDGISVSSRLQIVISDGEKDVTVSTK
jgi:hypothetical protein